MKQNVLLLPLIGAGLTIFCFILPWINIDLSKLNVDSPSLQFPDSIGSDMPKLKVEMPKPKLKGTLTARGFKLATGGANFVTLSLLAVITIIVICIYMQSQKTPLKSRLSLLICSSIGLLSLLYIILKNMQIISFGVYGAAIGFIIALFGAWKIPKSTSTME